MLHAHRGITVAHDLEGFNPLIGIHVLHACRLGAANVISIVSFNPLIGIHVLHAEFQRGLRDGKYQFQSPDRDSRASRLMFYSR